MAYASVSEFVDYVTVAEATALAKAVAPATGYDSARIGTALANATSELDTYFATKYPTPLDPVPDTARQAAIALAREALDRQGRDQVKTEAARWRTWARDVAKGIAVLAGGVVGTDTPAPSTAAGVQHSAPARVFDDTGLSPFLGRW